MEQEVWFRSAGEHAGLARLHLAMDHEALRLAVHLDGQLLVEEGLDPAGRARIAEAIERFVLSLPTIRWVSTPSGVRCA